jgi:hypothetical protein
MKEVTLKSTWVEILGKKREEMPDETRRARWEEWKKLSINSGKRGVEMANYWAAAEDCIGCIHKDKDWCKSQQLPCNVNPILTFSEGMIGMACMGAGHQLLQPQLDFEEKGVRI